MKISFDDIFDNLSVEQVNQICDDNITLDIDQSTIHSVKDNVMRKIELENKGNKRIRFNVKRVIAVVAVLAVVLSVTIVGAANYFKPDNSFNQFIELSKDVDYSTLGTDVDQTASSSGLNFYIGQVLCDNDIMVIPIKCPKYKGRYVAPDVGETNNDKYYFDILVDGKRDGDGCCGKWDDEVKYDGSEGEDYCNITLRGLSRVKNNSTVEIKFNHILYFDLNVEQIDDEYIYEECGVDGEWSFKFNINRANVRQKLDVKDFELENGEKYKLNNFVISPLGFKCDYKVSNWKYAERDESSLIKFPKHVLNQCTLFQKNISSSLTGDGIMYIEMKDGTILSDGDHGDSRFDLRCEFAQEYGIRSYGEIEATFTQTINVDEIKTITLLDNVIYEA